MNAVKPKVLGVIMGGGRGTRLHPLTTTRCKPAVPLAGKYRLVDIPISNCINSGINRIFVLTQFNTASLHRHIQESYKFDPFGGGYVDILSAEQTEHGDMWYQGTADAVRQNLTHFHTGEHDHAGEGDLFLILSGDQLYRMDFRRILEQHLSTGADVTIAAKPMPGEWARDLGVMRVEDDMRVAEFVEKPQDPALVETLLMSDAVKARIRDPAERDNPFVLASMGIYVFNRNTLITALKDRTQTDFGKEILPSLLGTVKLYGFVFDGYWEDIGTVRSFFEANLRLTDPVPPFNFFDSERTIFTHARFLPASKVNSCRMNRAIIADGCIITDADLERVVVGVRSVIGGGSRLENVVVMGMDHFETDAERAHHRETGVPRRGIGQNCIIRNAIIDKNARIGDNVTLDPAEKPDGFEKGDVVIRDGILIVVKNGVVPDNFTL